jgi:hypothetical protein
MEYLYYSLLAWIALFLCGLPFSLLVLPASLKKHAVAFAPTIGYCYVTFVGYYFYRFNAPGTNSYAFAVFTVPLILLAGYAMHRRKVRIDKDSLFNSDVLASLLLTLLAFGILSLPFLLLLQGKALSLSLGNLDLAELACGSRFLQEFPRNTQEGFMGQSAHYVWIFDNFWFGPSEIVAFMSSLLATEPYKLQSLVINMLAAQGVVMTYFLGRAGLKIPAWGAMGLSLLYTLSPIVGFTVWQSFGGQTITMPLMAGILIFHLRALAEPSSDQDYLGSLPVIVVLLSGIFVTYYYMVIIIMALAFCHLIVHTLLTRRWSIGVRVLAVWGAALAVSALLNLLRVRIMYRNLASLVSGNNGWFIPWLSPDVLLGANTSAVFFGGLRKGQWFFVIMSLGAFMWSFYHVHRSVRRTDDEAFLLGLFVPMFVLGTYLAVSGMEGHQWGGYRSFKITSAFCWLTLTAFFLSLRSWSWPLGTHWRENGLTAFLVIFFSATSLLSVWDMVNIFRSDRNIYVMPEDMVELKKVEHFSFVGGMNIPDMKDMGHRGHFELFWIHYFTLRKPQIYERFLYPDRVGEFNKDFYYMLRNQAQSQREPITCYVKEPIGWQPDYPLNRTFGLFKDYPTGGIEIEKGEGWWGREPTHEWTGSKGRSYLVVIHSRSVGLKAKITGRLFFKLREGDEITIVVNKNPIRVSHEGNEIQTQPFVLASGKSIVEFTHKMDPFQVSSDHRTFLAAWESIVVTPIL